MRKILAIAILTCLSGICNAQTLTTENIAIEKSVTGVQIGVFGIDFYNEFKLSKKIALRSEASLYAGIWWGTLYEETGFSLVPAISLQPKYYYNIDKRSEKGKNIKNNGANYFSIQVKYFPDWFAISNYDDLYLTNTIAFIPTFGIRRNFAQNFNYEFKVGYGYGFTFGEDENDSEATFDLSFKIGYDF